MMGGATNAARQPKPYHTQNSYDRPESGAQNKSSANQKFDALFGGPAPAAPTP